MDKNVRPYKQRGDTCAISCMMMVLEYFGVMEKANWYDERRLYRAFKSKYMDGVPFSALCYYFSKNGLNTSIYHSDKELFNNNLNVLDSYDFEHTMDEYKKYLDIAVKKGLTVQNGVDINSDMIKSKLKEGNLVILAGELNSGIYHAILISGYDKNNFYVCDPLYKNKQLKSEDEIEKFMNTLIGKWFISINDNTKEKQNQKN